MSARRVLVTCHDAGGTVPPVVALTQALRRAGHDVVVLSQPCVRDRAEAAGASFVPFTEIGDYDRRVALEEQVDVIGPAIAGTTVGDDLLAVAADRRVDVTVTDANLAGGLAAAETTDTPSVVLLHSVYRTFVDTWFGELWPLVGPPVDATRAAYGLPPASSWAQLFDAHDLLLPVVPRELDDDAVAWPPTLRHFGFLVPEPARAGAAVAFPDGRGPRVLVGLSTTRMTDDDLLPAIIEALGTTDARAVVTAGADAARVRDAHPNVLVTGYADHATLVGDADLVVTHGGLGTVAVALAAGVPLVCVPLDRDQPLNAARVEALGAGVRLEPGSPPATIADAVRRVTADDGFRAAAVRIARAARAAGGAAAAAAAVAGLADA